jgi:chemotaxis protein MotD
MSAVALNPSFGPLQSSPEPMRDPGRQPSGAFSFSSILKGINQQDAPANGGGSPVGVAESPENLAASPVGTASGPTPASDPFSIEAGLAALGYGPFDASQGSGTSIPMQKAVAATPSRAGSPTTTNLGIATPTPTAASPAGQGIAPSGPAQTSNPLSIEADLAALGYGPPEASQSAPTQSAVSQGSPSQAATAAQTPAGPVSPKSQAVLSPRNNPGLGAVILSPASSSETTDQNDAAGDAPTTSDPPPIGAALSGFGASPNVFMGAGSPGSAASVQTQNRGAPQRQVATTWRAIATPSAPPAGSASQGASAGFQAQTGGGLQSAVSSSARARPGATALGRAATDSAQGAPTSNVGGQTVVPQGVAFQVVVPRGAASPDLVSQAPVSQAPVSQAPVSGASTTSGTAPSAAAAPQNPFGAAPLTDLNLAGVSSASDTGSPLVANATDTISIAAIANPLTADPSLGLQSLQSRTYLAMTNALPVRVSAPARPATPSTSAPVGAPAAAAPTSSETIVQPGGAQPAQQRAAPASISPIDADASGSTPSSPAAPIAVAGPGIDPSSSGPASIPLSQLADFVADQASALTSPNSPSVPSASAAAPQAVKELEISLDPANLGAVSVKMRLANGKLSVVIGVSNSSTLAAIENERGAIAARLGSTEQPIENLVIVSRGPSNETSQDFAQANPGGNDASDQGSQGHARSNDNFSGARRGESGSARGRNDPQAASNSTGTTSGGGTGALLV